MATVRDRAIAPARHRLDRHRPRRRSLQATRPATRPAPSTPAGGSAGALGDRGEPEFFFNAPLSAGDILNAAESR
jgi:hypothetical protein